MAVPQEEVWDRLDELVQLYERMYRKQRLPFLLIEIRFSPAGHDRSCLGAGTDRATAWLCLCLNQSGAVGVYFDAVEQWVRSTRTVRIHLGKWCESLTTTDLAGMHGSRFGLFQQVRAAADSQDRFVNPFVERLLV